MYNETAFETLESFGEAGENWDSFDSHEFTELGERFRPRGRPRNVPRPRQGNAAVNAPQGGYATKAELEATANRLDGRIAVNTKAIDDVNGKVNALGTAHNRLEANTKRGFTTTKATTDKLSKNVENVKMAAMLMPLLTSPKTRDITVVNPTDATKTETVKVMVDDGDTFRTIAPMFLLNGGFGGGDSSGGSMSEMMIPLLFLTMGKK
jgi:hypothetical protein